MKIKFYLLIALLVISVGHSDGQATSTQNESQGDSIVRIEMHLSAFGVESDDFPSIDVSIDFVKDTSVCIRSFYNPTNKGSTYLLTRTEMQSIQRLLQRSALGKLKPEYTVNRSDQPRSKAKIYTTKKIVVVDDYGLVGDYPLPELYKTVYKIN